MWKAEGIYKEIWNMSDLLQNARLGGETAGRYQVELVDY